MVAFNLVITVLARKHRHVRSVVQDPVGIGAVIASGAPLGIDVAADRAVTEDGIHILFPDRCQLAVADIQALYTGIHPAQRSAVADLNLRQEPQPVYPVAGPLRVARSSVSFA